MAMAIIDGYKVGGVDEPTVADEYNEEREWEVGEFCIYNSTLYKCNTATTGEFDSDSWDVTSCGLEMKGINSNLTQYAHATLESGETTLEITDSRIVATSIIEPFFEVALGTEFEPLSYLTMKVEIGKVTFTFDSQETDIEIYIRVL